MKWMKEHDVFLRALSLIIAIFLWSYVMRVDNPDKTEEYRNVTVQLEGLSQLTDNGLVLLSGIPEASLPCVLSLLMESVWFAVMTGYIKKRWPPAKSIQEEVLATG